MKIILNSIDNIRSNKMSMKPEQAVSGFKEGWNCSQAVMSVCSEGMPLKYLKRC